MMTGGERLFPIDDATWTSLDPLTAAGVIIDSLGRRWDPRKHPRGRDGKFIRTGGLFRIFKNRSSRTVYGAGEVQDINDDGSVNVKVTRVARGNSETGVGRVIRVDARQLAVLESKAHLSKARDPLPRPEDRRLPDADGRNIRLGDRVRLRDGTETTVERIDMNRGRVLVRHPDDGRVMTPAAAGVQRLDDREDDDPLVEEMRGRQPRAELPDEAPDTPESGDQQAPGEWGARVGLKLVDVRAADLRPGDGINGGVLEVAGKPEVSGNRVRVPVNDPLGEETEVFYDVTDVVRAERDAGAPAARLPQEDAPEPAPEGQAQERERRTVLPGRLRKGDETGGLVLLEDPAPARDRLGFVKARVSENGDEYDMYWPENSEIIANVLPRAELDQPAGRVDHEALLPRAPLGWTRSPENDQPGQFPMFAYENAEGWRVEVTSHDGGQSHAFRVRKPDGEYLWPADRGVEHTWYAVQRKIKAADITPADQAPVAPEAPEAPARLEPERERLQLRPDELLPGDRIMFGRMEVTGPPKSVNGRIHVPVRDRNMDEQIVAFRPERVVMAERLPQGQDVPADAPEQPDAPEIALARAQDRLDVLGRIVPDGWSRQRDAFDGDQFSTHVMDGAGYQVDMQKFGDGSALVQVRRADATILQVDGDSWDDIEVAIAADMFTPEGRAARRVVPRAQLRDELLEIGVDPEVARNAANAESLAAAVDVFSDDPAYVRLRAAAWRAEMGAPGVAERVRVAQFNRIIRHAGQLDQLEGPLDASETPDAPSAPQPDAPEAPEAPEAPNEQLQAPPAAAPDRPVRRPVNRADQPEFLRDRNGLEVRPGDRVFTPDVGLARVLAVYQDGRARIQAEDGRIYARRMARLNRAPGAAAPMPAPAAEDRIPTPAAPPAPSVDPQEQRRRGQHLDNFIADFAANLDLSQEDQSKLDNWLFDDGPLAPEDARRIDGVMADRVRRIVGALDADELARIGDVRGELRRIYSGNPAADQIENAGPDFDPLPVIDSIARGIPNLADLPPAQRRDLHHRRRRNARLALDVDARGAIARGDHAARDAALERARVLFNLAGDEERESQVLALQGALANRGAAAPAERPVDLFNAPPAQDVQIGPIVVPGREKVAHVASNAFEEWGPRRAAEIRVMAETIRPVAEWHQLTQEQQMREVQKLFQGKFGGLYARVTSASVRNRYVHVSIDVLNQQGEKVGTVRRVIVAGSDGWAYNDWMSIQNAYRGTGFAAAFNRNAENFYIANGIPKVKVHAALSVGGYAWARNGFDWDADPDGEYGGSSQPLDTLERLVGRVREDRLDARTREQIAELRRRAQEAARKDDLSLAPTPFELSQIGWEPGAAHWLGQDLAGLSWHGEKRLTPNDRVYQQLIQVGRISAIPQPQPADASRGLGDPDVDLADVEVRDGFRPGAGGRVHWAARNKNGWVRDARRDADGDWEVYVEFDDGEQMWMPGRALREPENAAPPAPPASAQPREVDVERDNAHFDFRVADPEEVTAWIDEQIGFGLEVDHRDAIIAAINGDVPIADNPDAMHELWNMLWEDDVAAADEAAAEVNAQIEEVFPEWREERIANTPEQPASDEQPPAQTRDAAADAEWLAPAIDALQGISKRKIEKAVLNPEELPGFTVRRNGGQGVNGFNYIIRHNETARKYIVKIDTYHGGALAERDAAALAREIGLEGAPATGVVNLDNGETLIVQAFGGEQDGYQMIGDFERIGDVSLDGLNLADDDSVVGVMMLDSVTGNMDRHTKNVMLVEGPDGSVLVPIDNGGAWHRFIGRDTIDAWAQYARHQAIRPALADYYRQVGSTEFRDSINRWAEKIREQAQRLADGAEDTAARDHFNDALHRVNKILRDVDSFANTISEAATEDNGGWW